MSDSCFDCKHNSGSLCMLNGGCEFAPKQQFSGLEDAYDELGHYKQTIGYLLRKAQAKKDSKEEEKKCLDKLVNDHWDYIEGVIRATHQAHSFDDEYDLEHKVAEIEFHYKSSAKHFWGHAREYHVGETL